MPINYTFTVPTTAGVDTGYKRTMKPKVLMAEFGDGFAQRSAAGTNNDPETRDLSFSNLLQEEKHEIVAFFTARNGWQSFYWQGPGDATPLAFICTEWSIVHHAQGAYTVTAMFQQVYDV